MVREYFFRVQGEPEVYLHWRSSTFVCAIERILNCLQLSSGQWPFSLPVVPQRRFDLVDWIVSDPIGPDACHAILRGRRGAFPTARPSLPCRSATLAVPTRRQLPIAPSPLQPVHWSHASFTQRHPVVPAKAGNLASPPPADSPRPLPEGEGEGSDDRKCNQMQPNATELKVSPLLATPDEANQGHNQGRLAHRLRVNGVPNEAAVAPFPASLPGVNEANQGQMGPGINPPPSFPRRREPCIPGPSDPLALWERVRVRVRGRECNEMQSNATELRVRHSWPLVTRPTQATTRPRSPSAYE